MTALLTPTSQNRSRDTLADLLHRLGDISPARVRLVPPPGMATEADVLAIQAREKRLCELVEGALVEKPMGLQESVLAVTLATSLQNFVSPRRLGIISGEAGMMRISAGLIRIPDVAFISVGRLPGGKIPAEPIPNLAPDLAIEIISESNTKREMQIKLLEYFDAGVRLVWLVYPKTRVVEVYGDSVNCTRLAESEMLDGGKVLPGFQLPILELFAMAAIP